MFDHKVHHFARKKNKRNQMVNQLVRYTPYKVVVTGKPPKKYYLRDGQVCTASGEKVNPKDLPADVLAVFKGMTDEGKKHYGEPKVA
jgi:hypothetical protein